jgi:hypothetical protein
MNTTITTEYRGVNLIYVESDNSWTCEQFTKAASSLAEAKRRLDAKLDKEEKVPFQRFKAYIKPHFGDSYELADVTSITDDGKSVWVCHKGNRSKMLANSWNSGKINIYEDSDENRKLVEEYALAESGRKKCQQKKEEIALKMKLVDISKIK